MTDREIIIYLAEKVMGWEVFSLNRHNYDEFRHSTHRLVENVEHNWNYFPPGKPGNLWNPLENIADAFEVQAAFLYLGPNKRRRFTQSLNRIAWDENSPGFGRDWAMVGATARQRCLAIVEATK